ncbi:hypothetical protein G7009_01315 [Pseudomonas capeferrum]|uniref:hypothetical protein n=1 Tax=Pseudomonas capeferrum TaxID=1495066 RepID=UPI0015E493AE|nr:hypothetical protein [Pseudomonas capeferrum]MBA1200441.1 hypothetical protein [Pseudomonas capeferrum]
MAYNSAHTGAEIDAAVEMLGQVQSARDATRNDLVEVRQLASQVATDADQVADQAATVSARADQVQVNAAAVEQARNAVVAAAEVAADSKDAAVLAAASAQGSQEAANASELAAAQSQVAAGLSEQVSAEHAETSAAAALQTEANRAIAQESAESAARSAENAEAVVTGGTATSTPSPGKIPLADADGKINSEWLGPDIARAQDVQAATEAAEAAEEKAEAVASRTGGFLVPVAQPPLLRDDATPLQVGDRYFNTEEQAEYIYTDAGWEVNDSQQAIADLKQDLANYIDPDKGASGVGFDGEKLDDLLIYTKTLADYASLRSYTGVATTIAIRSMGSSGTVVRDQSVSGDDNLTKFIDGAGRQWRRIQTELTLEQCGISLLNTPAANATQLKAAILGGVKIAGSRTAYSFEFTGDPISYSGSVLQIDLGPHLHTFKNWSGIVASSVAVLEYSGRIDAGNSYCKGLGKFRRLQHVKIGSLEFQNVFCVNPTVDAQFFGLEYSSDTFGDNPLVLDIERVRILNVRTQTYMQNSGSAIPMTVLGNYGSGSSQIKQHMVRIGSFRIEEFYSVAQDGVTPLDGDSDVCRMFTNPTQLIVGSLYARNVAKRFVKSQETVQGFFGSVDWVNDTRFPAGVFIGFFEGQSANSGVPSHFEIGVCRASYPNADASLPMLFNASGLDHSIRIGTLIYKNVGFYSADRDVGITIDVAIGECLAINAPQSRRLDIKRIKDTGIRSISVAKGTVANFDIAYGASITSNGFILAGVSLISGNFRGWKTTSRVAQFYNIVDVTLDYASGASYTRAFVPVSGGIRSAERLTINDPTLLVTQIFEAPSNGSGVFVLRNFRAIGGASIGAGFFSSGMWEVRLDDCVPATFTGSGASVKSVAYS